MPPVYINEGEYINVIYYSPPRSSTTTSSQDESTEASERERSGSGTGSSEGGFYGPTFQAVGRYLDRKFGLDREDWCRPPAGHAIDVMVYLACMRACVLRIHISTRALSSMRACTIAYYKSVINTFQEDKIWERKVVDYRFVASCSTKMYVCMTYVTRY